ncbi:hypothetical protein AALD74_16320 [Lachnospiraceae bacterium 48-21]
MNLLFLFIVVFQWGVIFVLFRFMRYQKERIENEIDKVHKGLEFYDILIRWVKLWQNQRVLAEYFRENGYETVAIYGMKEIGQLLLYELKQEGIQVRYAIDRNAGKISADIPVVEPSFRMPEVDVIVVTAPHYFDSIYLSLREMTTAEIISVEDVLWGI